MVLILPLTGEEEAGEAAAGARAEGTPGRSREASRMPDYLRDNVRAGGKEIAKGNGNFRKSALCALAFIGEGNDDCP